MINTCYYVILCNICTTNPHIFKAKFCWATELENVKLDIISNKLPLLYVFARDYGRDAQACSYQLKLDHHSFYVRT